ncbi:hypothetical protein ORV05_35480 [Amycolatopsis cynarae]|uniref:Uncharacterized protein n=1 Tax=Amycolatopsis cynarae TaxID=2995223 RepID=A0ABY7B1D4_9PSEU|nr:hypothetical protein [Amycolatopsis sp. HUAS 11-8]WAL66090.1 hypothetical protein ORV05_35480 [Amycolatopsis sp. HUAS 11-8]
MSSSKGEAEFGDGTEAATFGDPLSGSALSGPADDSDDFQLSRVASPVKPDPAGARRLVDAEIGGERRPAGEFEFADSLDQEPAGVDGAPPASPAKPIEPAPPLGMLPKQRARAGFRAIRPSLKRPSLRLPRSGSSQPGTVRRAKASNSSTGIFLALLLLIAFLFVAFEFVSSLISSISGLFG